MRSILSYTIVLRVKCFTSHKYSKPYVTAITAKLMTPISATLILFDASEFTTLTPIIRNKYVISLISIASVLYLIIPNIAKRPSPIPVSISSFFNPKQRKNVVKPIR